MKEPSNVDHFSTDLVETSRLSGWLDEIQLEGDVKSVLKSILQTTHEAGLKVIRVGQWLLSRVYEIAKEFPCTAMGMTIGFICGLLVTSIPFIGWLLGPPLMAIVVTAGTLAGFVSDIYAKTLKQRVQVVIAEAAPSAI